MTVLSKELARRELQDNGQLSFVREAAEAIYAGALVAINSAGKVINAADTAGLKVIGVAQETVAPGSKVNVKTGIWGFAVSGITIANVTETATVVDNNTLGLAAGTTNDIIVGQIVDVRDGLAFVKIAFGN